MQASPQLTDGNFKQFVRELCQVHPLTSCADQYISLLALNRHRTALAAPLLAANYERCPNLYLRITFIKRLGQFLEGKEDAALGGLLRRCIEEVGVVAISEATRVKLFFTR